MPVALFVYGQLQPGLATPPNQGWVADTIKADLFDLGADAAAINIGQSNSLIHGFTLAVDEATIKTLDEQEAPEYKRCRTTTGKGVKAFVYERVLPFPSDSPKVESWP